MNPSKKDCKMKTTLKALVAGAFALLLAGTASAHGHGRVFVDVRPYYPPVVQVQPRYVPVPAYYQQQYVYAEPAFRADWRHEQWRREQWRREHWRHERCRHHHWR